MFIKYPDLGIKEREEQLQNECAKKEMRNYSHSLQQSEIDGETREYAQDGMELNQLKEQIKNIKDDYAAKIKAVEDRMIERLEKIKFGKKTLSGYLYGVADHTTKRMMYYDKFGELIESRDLLPDEMQGRLFIHEKKKAGDQPFETNVDTRTQEEKDADDKIAKDVKPDFTPVQKNDTKRASKGKKQFEHNEDGWAQMGDAELLDKYGTIDISIIRTMQLVGEKWLEPKDIKQGDLQQANADKNKKDKPLTENMIEYISHLRQGITVEKPNSAVIHSLKAKGIIDANGELTHYGKTVEL